MNEDDKNDRDDFVWEHLSRFGQLAHDDASLEILQVVAAASGVTEINGVPLRVFFERRKREIVERLIADFADTNPALASRVKMAWEKIALANDS